MFDLRKILGIASHAMPHLGGIGQAQKKVQPMQYAQRMAQLQTPSQPIQMGQVQGTENHVPQDPTAPMSDPTDTQNYLQAAYNNPQTSLNSGFQQQAPQQNLQQSADPYGWLRSQLRY